MKIKQKGLNKLMRIKIESDSLDVKMHHSFKKLLNKLSRQAEFHSLSQIAALKTQFMD